MLELGSGSIFNNPYFTYLELKQVTVSVHGVGFNSC